MLTCPCSFHRGIKRQDIGLEGHRIDHADDVTNARRGVVNIAHGAFHLPHRGLAFAGYVSGRLHQRIGLLGIVGAVINGRGDLFHGS